MTKVGSMTVDDEPAPERNSQGHNFSTLQGLQVVGENPWAGEEQKDDRVQNEALTLELEARAARFHHSVDASIVLTNDGTLRWLGDPIAKLAPGADLLTPSAIILSDSRLPDTARQSVAARVDLWLVAQTRKLLGPLFSLRDLEEGPDPVRDLAGKIAKALGVLERDSVRNQIKAFDQTSRAALRKHGVRFGAYYIYVPTLLKPAARALALQLWGLQTPGIDSDALAQALAPMASSGRTSLPFDQLISRDGYRVAGFRPCGDRVVRVDIVERLADMIRGAFIQPGAATADRPQGGFVVNGQMTSLTGCSGEAFSSILRSLGFESSVIRRSELPTAPAATGPQEGAVVETPAGEELVETPASTPLARSADDPLADSTAGPKTGEDTQASPVTELQAPSTVAEEQFQGHSLDLDGAETITIWRPVRRARPGRPSDGQRAKGGSQPQPRTSRREQRGDPSVARVGHSEHIPPKRRCWEPPVPAETEKGTRPSHAPEPSEGPPPDEHRRQPANNRGMARPKASPGPSPAAVDPNSPFAKLLELRSLLEKQGKNRR